MKNVKALFRIGILTFCVSTFLTNCEKDESNILEQQNPQSVHRISLSDFSMSTKKDKSYHKLESYFDFNRNNKQLSYNRIEQGDDITVLTNDILLIQKDSIDYYTFKVLTNSTGSEFYNLVVHVNNNQEIIKSEIYQYNPTDIWLENTSLPYSGHISVFENDVIDLNNVFDRAGNGCIVAATGSWGCSFGNEHSPGECNGSYFNYTIQLQYGPCEYIAGDEELGTGGGGGFWLPNGGGGSSATNNNQGNTNDTGTDTTPVIPMEPTVQEKILNCINAPSLLGDNNTYIDPEIFEQLNLSKFQWAAINNSLQNNGCSEEAQEFAVNFINANLNSPFEVDLFEFAPEDNITTPDNRKFMCIYNKLASSPSFKSLFIDTFNESSDMHITFALSDSFPNTQSAVTSPDSLNSASHQTITLNSNHLTTKHPLTIAQTIIHEALHAFLNYKQSNGICNPNNDGPSIYELESLTLGELLNDFNYNCIENATNDHNLMFNLLIPVMEQQLNEVFNDLVAPEDLNPTQFFYPPPNGEQNSFTWENAIYYMSLVGLGEANSFTTTTNNVPNEETSSYLFQEYNIRVNSNAFNKLTCEE